MRHAADGGAGSGRDGVIDVSLPPDRGRTFVQALTSLAGVIGVALLAPFAILLVGSPVALAVRALADAIGWLFTRLFV